MKNVSKIISFVVVLLLLISCNTIDNDNEPTNEINTIEIGNYKFDFPSEFELIESEGIDSYVGTVVGSGIILYFDFGWYTSALSNLPIDEYLVTEDEFNGHFRQIVKPINSEINNTRIHLYNINESIESAFGYNSLTLSTSNLTSAEQELVITIFNSVEIVE